MQLEKMIGSTLRFSFKNCKIFSQSLKTNNIMQTFTPFYLWVKSISRHSFKYDSIPNCSNIWKKNGISLVRKSISNCNSSFVPSALIMSSFSFFAMELEDEEEENQITKTLKRAIYTIQRGDPTKGEQLLHDAVEVAQKMKDEDTVTYIYDMLANFALQNEQYEKAENLFTILLNRFLQNHGLSESNNAVVETRLKLATIYSNLGDKEKAVQGFQFCIETQDKKLNAEEGKNVDEDNLELWAMSHNCFARFLITTTDYELAKKHIKLAYDGCVKVKGKMDLQLSFLLNDLGSVCCLLQNYDEAIDYVNKAISLAKLCNSEDLALYYVNLGIIYTQKNCYNEAEQFCKQGMQLAKNTNNEDALKESKDCLNTLKTLLA